jgi:predicted DNA-binding protein with PD1-like motif
LNWKLSDNNQKLAIICKPGDNLNDSIVQACVDSEFGSGFIISCIGALEQAHITAIISTGDGFVYDKIREISGALEMVVMSGNVQPKVDGGWKVHIHALLVHENKELVAGHLADNGNIVGVTAEILISKFSGLMRGLPTPQGPSFINFSD